MFPKANGGIVTRIITGFVLLLMSISGLADKRAPLTNADIVAMKKSGMGEHTIVLAIGAGPNNFNTSPASLVQLKKAGVSDAIIDAILMSAQSKHLAESQPLTGEALIAKALDAFGPHEKLIAVHSSLWTASVTQSTADGKTIFEEQRVQVYPGLTHIALSRPPGEREKIVVTPDFSYRTAGGMTIATPSGHADIYRQEMKFDPIQISQHLSDYTFTRLEGDEKDGAAVDVLKISADGMDCIWRIDAQTGLLLSAKHQLASGEVMTEFSDYRLVDGINQPFNRHIITSQSTTDVAVSSYEPNSTIDETIFTRPRSLSPPSLSLKVLQAETVSYTSDLGADPNTISDCQISQSAKMSAGSGSLDDIAFTKGQAGSNVRMTCNPWDKNWIFPRKLNSNLVLSSDGNAYVIACDKAWWGSKCVPLEVGLVFNANRMENKIQVEGGDAKGKKDQATYTILLSQSVQ
jgi:hypothetical protein